MIFKSYQGQAKLIHETTDKSWSCEVQIEQLINGRVIAKCIIFPADKELEKLDLSLTGTLEDQFEFKCIGLQFRKSALVTSGKNFFKHEFVYDIMSAELTNLTIEKPETVNLEVHLTNFRWYHKKQIDFELKGYQCQLENMRTDNEAEDSAAYYQHPMIKSILHLKKVKSDQLDKVEKFIETVVFQLSIASRGYCCITAITRKNSIDNLIIHRKIMTPLFLHRYSTQERLIPDENIPQFLNETFDSLDGEQGKWFGNVCDHYFHALLLNSIWPSSLGIFTAMENLKHDFYKNNPHYADTLYWSKNKEKEQYKTILKDICNILSEKLKDSKFSEEEKKELKSQLDGETTRRSYKTQLIGMLERIGVDFKQDDLRPLIKVRNNIIHTGHHDETELGWERVRQMAGLLEKTILAHIKYKGIAKYYDKLDWEK